MLNYLVLYKKIIFYDVKEKYYIFKEVKCELCLF